MRRSAKGRVVRGDADTSLTVVVPPCVSAGAVNARVVVGTVATNSIAASFVGSGGLLALQPLEGITVSGADLGSCLQLVGGGASYLLVPQSAASSAGTPQLDFALVAEAPTLGTEAAAPIRLTVPKPASAFDAWRLRRSDQRRNSQTPQSLPYSLACRCRDSRQLARVRTKLERRVSIVVERSWPSGRGR